MTETILIVGAGIAGLSAAQAVAKAGARACVVERLPVVGGRLAATMTRAEAIGHRAEGHPVPLFDALAEDERIEIFTNAELAKLTGRAGSFEATIVEHARFVTDACTRCKLCHAVCPVVLPNEFDVGLTFRKAIYTPMIHTFPEAWAIDIENCLNTPPNYLPCNRCVEVCDDDAIHFDEALERTHERHVAAVILAPGMAVESGDAAADLGYGNHPDIVTAAEMQRLLESPGPTGGYAMRPSNEEYPETVLLVLDDPSPFALYIASSQAKQLLDQDVGRVCILALSAPRNAESIPQLAAATGIDVCWGAGFRVDPGEEDLRVSFEDLGENRFRKDAFDMVVLCTDVLPPESITRLAKTAGVEMADTGYLSAATNNGASVSTSVPGVFVAGCGSAPKTISDSLAEASSAAAAALEQLNPILLDDSEPSDASAKPSRDDDAREQIEKLLYALLESKS